MIGEVACSRRLILPVSSGLETQTRQRVKAVGEGATHLVPLARPLLHLLGELGLRLRHRHRLRRCLVIGEVVVDEVGRLDVYAV